MVFIQIGIMIVLAGIAFQDLKSRSVYAFWFPALAAGFICYRLLLPHNDEPLFTVIGTNLVFLFLQFLLVSAYFSFKQRQWVNITSGLLGWGDILFLISTAFFLSVINFLLFYVLSLIVVLITWLAWLQLSGTKNRHTPLAGLQAILFAAVLSADWFYAAIDLTGDGWLLNYFN